DDRGECAPVDALAPQKGTAIAEEPLLFGHRVVPSDFNRRDPGPAETVGDITPQVEQKMAAARRRDEPAGAAEAIREEGLWKFRPDLVGALSDTRADRRADIARRGAERRHPRDGSLDD